LGANGADEIKKHPFFACVDWETLLRKEHNAPFVPIIMEDTDCSNISCEFTEQPLDSYKDNEAYLK